MALREGMVKELTCFLSQICAVLPDFHKATEENHYFPNENIVFMFLLTSF